MADAIGLVDERIPRIPPFQLGDICIAEGARSLLSPEIMCRAVARHARGDWGELNPQEATANRMSTILGGRLLSEYHDAQGTTFWVITEEDRTATSVVLSTECWTRALKQRG
jgi:hypothetical protein